MWYWVVVLLYCSSLSKSLISQCSLGSACREMKKGNIGVALGMVGKKLKNSFGGSVDLGLTGKDGVVHPSLTVRILNDSLCQVKDQYLSVVRRLRQFCFSFHRKVQRNSSKMSPFSDQLWRACCTDTER